MGVSSFAYQGTNAHAVLHRVADALAPETISHVRRPAMLWDKSRCWVVPQARSMLVEELVSTSNTHATVQIAMGDHAVYLASHRQHVIQGSSTVSASAFTTMVSEACHVLGAFVSLANPEQSLQRFDVVTIKIIKSAIFL